MTKPNVSIKTRKKMSEFRKKFLKENPEKNYWYRHGKTLIDNYCKECGDLIDWRAERCKSCSSKNHNELVCKCMYCKAKRGEYNGSSNPCKEKYLLVVKICKQCKKEYKQKSNNNSEFCSENCSHYWHKGKNHNWYIDGRTLLSFAIRNLEASKQWRISIFERDKYICQICGQYGGFLEAHHIKKFSKILSEFLKKYNQFSPIEDKETLIRLAITYKPFWKIKNGQTLCENCHKKTLRKECCCE